MTTVEFAFHVHEDVLVEPLVEPIENRIAYIRKHKKAEEVPIRVALLKKVRGELPAPVIAAGLIYGPARQKYSADRQEYITARQKYEAIIDKYDDAPQNYDAAWQEYYAVRNKYLAARKEFIFAQDKYLGVLKSHQAEIERLHAEECPDCPWNGTTISCGFLPKTLM